MYEALIEPFERLADGIVPLVARICVEVVGRSLFVLRLSDLWPLCVLLAELSVV